MDSFTRITKRQRINNLKKKSLHHLFDIYEMQHGTYPAEGSSYDQLVSSIMDFETRSRQRGRQ